MVSTITANRRTQTTPTMHAMARTDGGQLLRNRQAMKPGPLHCRYYYYCLHARPTLIAIKFEITREQGPRLDSHRLGALPGRDPATFFSIDDLTSENKSASHDRVQTG